MTTQINHTIKMNGQNIPIKKRVCQIRQASKTQLNSAYKKLTLK